MLESNLQYMTIQILCAEIKAMSGSYFLVSGTFHKHISLVVCDWVCVCVRARVHLRGGARGIGGVSKLRKPSHWWPNARYSPTQSDSSVKFYLFPGHMLPEPLSDSFPQVDDRPMLQNSGVSLWRVRVNRRVFIKCLTTMCVGHARWIHKLKWDECYFLVLTTRQKVHLCNQPASTWLS